MKKDRELIQLARSNLSADQIAIKMKITHATARKVAKRLGSTFRQLPQTARAGRRSGNDGKPEPRYPSLRRRFGAYLNLRLWILLGALMR
jgi:hypothetical protein